MIEKAQFIWIFSAMFNYFINMEGVFGCFTDNWFCYFTPPAIEIQTQNKRFRPVFWEHLQCFSTLLECTDLWTPGAFDSETDSILDTQDKS